MKDNNESSFSSLLKSKPYDIKKGIVFGAIGGFVAAIAFTGMILCMSSFFKYPEGTFFDSIGISIVNNNSIVSIGLGSLAIILIHGIIIGILLGLIISAIKPLNPKSRKKGIGLGILAGFISFIVLYVPMVNLSSIYSNLVTKTLSTFSSSTFLATRGIESTLSTNIPIEGILIWGLISYLVFGFIAGGIITLAYSIYNFDRKEIEKVEKK